MRSESLNDNLPEFAADLLRGAEEIAQFLFGDTRHRRKVYHLAEKTNFPIFRLGSLLCARRTKVLNWIADQENRGRRVAA
jgi:hypothetical protein